MSEDKVRLNVVDEDSETQARTSPITPDKAAKLQEIITTNASNRGADVRTAITQAKNK